RFTSARRNRRPPGARGSRRAVTGSWRARGCTTAKALPLTLLCRLPALLHALQRGILQRFIIFFNRILYKAETAAEFRVRSSQRIFRISFHMSADIDEREDQVPEFVGHLVLASAPQRLAQFSDLLLDLVEDQFCLRPV